MRRGVARAQTSITRGNQLATPRGLLFGNPEVEHGVLAIGERDDATAACGGAWEDRPADLEPEGLRDARVVAEPDGSRRGRFRGSTAHDVSHRPEQRTRPIVHPRETVRAILGPWLDASET